VTACIRGPVEDNVRYLFWFRLRRAADNTPYQLWFRQYRAVGKWPSTTQALQKMRCTR